MTPTTERHEHTQFGKTELLPGSYLFKTAMDWNGARFQNRLKRWAVVARARSCDPPTPGSWIIKSAAVLTTIMKTSLYFVLILNPFVRSGWK